MTLSHAYTHTSTSSTEVLNKLLEDVISIHKQSRKEMFSTLEITLHQVFASAERLCMQQLLEQYDWDFPSFASQGKNYRKVTRNCKQYMTLAGEVRVERSLYRTERNGPTCCPLELNTGLIEGFWTPQAAKQAVHLVSQLTPAEAEQVFKEFGLMAPSKSSLDRLPKKISQCWEENRLPLDTTLQNQYKIPESARKCAISLDGVLIPTRYTRVIRSDSRWAEAACGTVSFFDSDGELLSTRYLARMPEHKKRILKQQLAAQIHHIVKQRPDLDIIKVADGARDNWTFLDGQIKEGECVLDFYHAAQHLFVAMQCIHGKQSYETVCAFDKYREILLKDPNGIDKLIRHLHYQMRKNPTLKALKTEITYFTRHRKRCDYARLKSENKPIGSGIVEAACKTVVQMRLKRSGQHWDDKGGQAILTFRSILLSKQFDSAWEEVKNFYYKPIVPPNNVVKFPKIGSV